MRKGFEGLYGLVRDRLSCEPLSGHLFVFCNAQRNRLKVLVWDGSGLWVVAERDGFVADNELHPSRPNPPVYFVDIDNVLGHRTEVLDEGLALRFAPEQSKKHLRVGSERAGKKQPSPWKAPKRICDRSLECLSTPELADLMRLIHYNGVDPQIVIARRRQTGQQKFPSESCVPHDVLLSASDTAL
jgi:hypothetical protein